MKLRDLVDGLSSIQKLSELPLKLPVAHKLAKFINDTKTVLELYEKRREAIIKENGEEQENGSFNIPKDKIVFVNEEINKILNESLEEMKIEIPKIKLEDLGDISFPAIDLAKLSKIIVE